MALKAVYDKQDDIPEAHRDLFVEKGDKWEIQVEGMKTTADVDRLSTSLEKERTDHKETKAKLKPFSGLNLEDVQAKLDKYDELEALAGTKTIDDDKINELVEKRIKTQLAPIQRENETLKASVAEKDTALTEFQKKDTKRTVNDTVRDAATKAKVRPEALPDVLLLGEHLFKPTEDGKVATAEGLTPDLWLGDMQKQRPHWWPESSGGGSNPGGGGQFSENPFSAENWNMTKQGQVLRESPEKAEQMAKAAGTTVGGKKPETKPAA